MMNGPETVFRAGHETLGGKRNFEREKEIYIYMQLFVIWPETTRSADAPGMREVVFPGRRLHVASPSGPWPPGL